jgi:hypothetical protein
MEIPVKEKTLPFCCPICGRITDYPVTDLTEGAILTCPFCKLRLTLHGHMWEDVQREIKKLTKANNT